MRRTLRLHPDSFCPAVTQIEVGATRLRGHLVLDYRVTGRIGDLKIPPPAAAERAHELWRHTCFEAFIRAVDRGYYEFNFSPSTQWAAYRFEGYRTEGSSAEVNPPRIDGQSAPESYVLRASLQLGGLAALPADDPWQLGLTAIIEEINGRTSYWALGHPPGKPDFHRADCFALEIASA
jgi:hypothetical protein